MGTATVRFFMWEGADFVLNTLDASLTISSRTIELRIADPRLESHLTLVTANVSHVNSFRFDFVLAYLRNVRSQNPVCYGSESRVRSASFHCARD